MKIFERNTPDSSVLDQPAKHETAVAADTDLWRSLLEGQKPTAERRLAFAHEVRDRIFNTLTELGEMRARQKQVKTEAFQTLQFMIQSGYLNERGKGDANVFLAMDDVVKDEALSQIAFLRETDEDISSFEQEAGYTDEEIDARTRVRRQHESAYEAEWGVS